MEILHIQSHRVMKEWTRAWRLKILVLRQTWSIFSLILSLATHSFSTSTHLDRRRLCASLVDLYKFSPLFSVDEIRRRTLAYNLTNACMKWILQQDGLISVSRTGEMIHVSLRSFSLFFSYQAVSVWLKPAGDVELPFSTFISSLDESLFGPITLVRWWIISIAYETLKSRVLFIISILYWGAWCPLKKMSGHFFTLVWPLTIFTNYELLLY